MVRSLLVVSIVTGLALPAAAQPRGAESGWNVTVGGGMLLAPNYAGDNSYRLSAIPNLQLSYGDRFFASVQEGIGYRFVNDGAVKAGPIMRFTFPRDENGKQIFAVTGHRTNDLRGLGDVDLSVELGGFVEYEIAPVTLRAEVRQAASGHKGFTADLSAQWSHRTPALGSFAIVSFGPRVRLVDATYNSAYFGVTGAQSRASGLPTYSAGGGLYSFGAGATVVYPLPSDRRWAVVAVGGYDRLTGDAGASPLVQQRGSQNQALFGLFVSRAF